MIDNNHSQNVAVRRRAGFFHLRFLVPLLITAFERQSLLVLGWVFLATTPAVQAQFTYTNVNGTATITGYTSTNNDVVIPSTIDGLPVVNIGADAFDGTGIAVPLRNNP